MAEDEITEVCQKCGGACELVWHAPDKLWRDVTGFKDGEGILCVNCFAALVWKRKHRFLYWSCDIRRYPRHAIFQHLRHHLRQLRLKIWLRRQARERLSRTKEAPCTGYSG